jgi:prolyl 4-hydroxylase
VSAVENAYRLLEGGDAQAAIAELERAGDAGDASSFLELAVWNLEGRLVPRDLHRSRDYFRRSGDLGQTTAEHVYICFLANGVGGAADWQAANDRLRKLAQTDGRAARQIELVDVMHITADGYPVTVPEGRQLSASPEAHRFEALFSPAECDYLVQTAEPLLQQSVVVDPATGVLRPHPVRTSDGASFPWASEDLVISALNRRIAAASGTDVKCGEPLQVLRYRPGQEYRPHFDALPSNENQRVLTMLVYLNSGYSGGETSFTRAGLTVAGRMGDALLFRNARPGGSPDLNAEHAGLPVSSGEKYLASRWIRERPMIAT